MTAHVKQAVAISLLKSVWFEHSFLSFIITARCSPGDKVDPDNAMRWEHNQEIAPGTENERDLLVLPVSLKADIPQGLCENISKIIKYRPYIHYVIHSGFLSQLEVLACLVWYIQTIRAMKTNVLYLQVCLTFLGGL